MSLVFNPAYQFLYAPGPDTPSIHFYSRGQFTILFADPDNRGAKKWNGDVYYSEDKISWHLYEWSSYIQTKSIYFCGIRNTAYRNDGVKFKIGSYSSPVYCEGDLAGLLDYVKASKGELTSAFPFAFNGLFRECPIVSAPSLNFQSLELAACQNMFESCLQLETPPALPARSVGYYAYNNMFYNSGVNRLPSFLQMTGDIDALNNMFYGSKVKVSEQHTAEYPYSFSIPFTGASSGSSANNMFYGTQGTFQGSPKLNTTYYTDKPLVT